MRRLFREYGSRNVLPLGLGVLTSVAARGLDLLPPLILGIAIDSVFTDPPSSSLPGNGMPASPTTRFAVFTVLIGLSYFGGALFHWGRNLSWNAFAQNIQHCIRTETYDVMQRLPMRFFDRKRTGELMSILSNDVNRLENFLNEGMNSALRLSLMVGGVAVILFALNWQLAIVTLLPVPLIGGFTYWFVRTIRPRYERVRSSVGALNSRLENNLDGIEVIKTSNAEAFESERVSQTSRRYYEANWDAIRTRNLFFPVLRVLSGLGFTLTFVVGGLWVLGDAPFVFSGTLTVGQFVSFLLYTQLFIWPMAQFGQIINMYQRARASCRRIFALMDRRESAEDTTEELPTIEGHVRYEGVSFGYDEGYDVEGISFTARPGDTVALVGPTGAGKTTVLKLLPRLYEFNRGRIYVDGREIRGISRRALRRQIGYVSQDPYLFYGTVRENILYGRPEGDDAPVLDAARRAEAHAFIRELPEGYDTVVGERGVRLSGGERQRITIARALLQDPPILILDEATSEVDARTERLIQRGMDRLKASRTTLTIAHSLPTVRDADTILVLRAGRIVERGTHDQLIKRDGVYAQLWGTPRPSDWASGPLAADPVDRP